MAIEATIKGTNWDLQRELAEFNQTIEKYVKKDDLVRWKRQASDARRAYDEAQRQRTKP